MTPDEKAYFEEQMDTFASAGWKHFAAQVDGMVKSTDRIEGVAEKDLRFKQGELSIMRWILNWPAMIEQEYSTRLAEDEAAAKGENADAPA